MRKVRETRANKSDELLASFSPQGLIGSWSYFINYIIDPKEDISQSVVIFEWPTLTLDSHDCVRHHVSGIAAAILHGINLHLIFKYSGSTTLSVSRQCTIQYVNRANMLQRLLNILGVALLFCLRRLQKPNGNMMFPLFLELNVYKLWR